MVKHGFERIADGGLVPVEMAAEEVQMKGWLHLENPLGRLFDGETGEEVHDFAEQLDRIGYVPSSCAPPIFDIYADTFPDGRQHRSEQRVLAREWYYTCETRWERYD